MRPFIAALRESSPRRAEENERLRNKRHDRVVCGSITLEGSMRGLQSTGVARTLRDTGGHVTDKERDRLLQKDRSRLLIASAAFLRQCPAVSAPVGALHLKRDLPRSRAVRTSSCVRLTRASTRSRSNRTGRQVKTRSQRA